jgi:hypothetical protein
MTKLDEAVEAASAAYDTEADRGGSHERAMALAIQAAMTVLVPDAKDPRRFNKDEYIYRAKGWDDCHRNILKNAGIE